MNSDSSIEYVLANDEGVVHDGFYGMESASRYLTSLAEDGEGLFVAKASDYDENGDFIEDGRDDNAEAEDA